MGAEHIQAFNVVGPGEWAGQQLLRVGLGHSHLLITPSPRGGRWGGGGVGGGRDCLLSI